MEWQITIPIARIWLFLLAFGLQAGGSDLESARNGYVAGMAALNRADLPEAKRLITAALEAGQRAGMSGQDLTEMRISLGIAYRGLYELSAADELLSQALRDLERISDENPNLYATAAEELGVLRLEQGQFVAAETLLRSALEIFRRSTGVNDIRTMSELAQLGEALFALGRIADGERVVLEGIDRLRQSGDKTTLLGNALASLGRIRLSQGRVHEAQALLTESTGIHLHTTGESGLAADSLTSLAVAFREDRQFDRAVPLLRKAEKIYAASGDLRISLVRIVLGGIELDERRTTLAERHFRQAIQRLDEAGAENGVHAAVARVGLARALARQGRLTEAKAEAAIAVEIQQKNLGSSQHEIVDAFLVQAEIAELSKEYATAERNYREAIRRYTSFLPSSHPLLVAVQNEYSRFLKRRKR